jgi:hypothetical protein
MDKYEATLARVIDATSSGVLVWEPVGQARYADVVVNADRVVRAYQAELELKEKRFPLVFVEKRTPWYDEFDKPAERMEFELHVLDKSRHLVLSLYDGVVERRDLQRLAASIKQSSGSAKEFFEALQAAEADGYGFKDSM